MTLLIDNRLNQAENYHNFFEEAIEKAMSFLNLQFSVEVSLLLTDNQEIRLLNQEYRGMDKATDVLSFPMLDLTPFDQSEPSAPRNVSGRQAWLDEIAGYIPSDGRDLVLGDIVISVERAEEQAGEYGHCLQRELGFLMVHGLLHLLGFDHENSQEEEQAMINLQEAILQELNLPRG